MNRCYLWSLDCDTEILLILLLLQLRSTSSSSSSQNRLITSVCLQVETWTQLIWEAPSWKQPWRPSTVVALDWGRMWGWLRYQETWNTFGSSRDLGTFKHPKVCAWTSSRRFWTLQMFGGIGCEDVRLYTWLGLQRSSVITNMTLQGHPTTEAQVRNKSANPQQITAEQLLREANFGCRMSPLP